ncbi:MAG TPA: SRPBCC family protein, partial [Longimicrobium sp.]
MAFKIEHRIGVAAPADAVWRLVADVERWPEWLPHYRWVRFQRKDGFGTGLVEMAARRWFGPLPW